jgi:DNA-directed RNA polymerase subunit RPC12/RpoP
MRSFDPEGDRRRKTANDLFLMGRALVKSGDRAQGRRLLEQAVEKDPDHDQAWVWLSATTDDPAEQKQYLEWAVAANPANAQARQGLAILAGRLNPKDLVPEGTTVAPRRPAEPEAAVVRRTFDCPQCGGRLRFDPKRVGLRCESCGFVEAVEAAPAAGHEEILDVSLPTLRGHRWAEAERRFTCPQCGAGTVLPAGQTSGRCPFCGSPALIAAPEEAELLPPQAVIPMGLEADQVAEALEAWLGRGFFAPDDLAHLARNHGLRPAYVPFWTFSATLNTRWQAQVEEGSGKNRQWIWRTGERALFYTDHPEPGTRGLPADLLRSAEPFDLSKLAAYKPEYLAGWPAVTYDISLADASLAAREAMIKDARKQLRYKAAPGRAVRNLEVSSGEFSGQTYRLVLLPLWVGAYAYRGKTYRVLVNGQTGTVAGDKPRDWVKVGLVAAGVLILITLVLFLVWFLLSVR